MPRSILAPRRLVAGPRGTAHRAGTRPRGAASVPGRLWWAATVGVLVIAGPAGRVLAEEICADVVIVQDRSGSMDLYKIDGEKKWDLDLRILGEVLPSLDKRIAMGLAMFPDENAPRWPLYTGVRDVCMPGVVRLDPAPGNTGAIMSRLKAAGRPYGLTPTFETMRNLLDYSPFKKTDRKHFVILITDGQPNCSEKECCPELETDPNPKRCSDPCFFFGCRTATSTVAETAALAARGVKTFVVGFAGKGEVVGGGGGLFGPSCGKEIEMTPPFDPASLDAMAEAGGMARDVPPNPRKYYDVSDAATFRAALEEIAGRVAGATVGGCTFGPTKKDGGAAGGQDGGGAPADGGGGNGDGPAGQGGQPGPGRSVGGGCDYTEATRGLARHTLLALALGLAALGLASTRERARR